MKRKWLYIGVAAASVLQFFFERFWQGFLLMTSHADICPVLRESSQLVFNFLSEVAFALVVGFFYLHVPDQKRSLTSGITIGSILGLLIGLYRFLDWYRIVCFFLLYYRCGDYQNDDPRNHLRRRNIIRRT